MIDIRDIHAKIKYKIEILIKIYNILETFYNTYKNSYTDTFLCLFDINSISTDIKEIENAYSTYLVQVTPILLDNYALTSSGLLNNTKMLHNQNNRNNQSNEKLYILQTNHTQILNIINKLQAKINNLLVNRKQSNSKDKLMLNKRNHKSITNSNILFEEYNKILKNYNKIAKIPIYIDISIKDIDICSECKETLIRDINDDILHCPKCKKQIDLKGDFFYSNLYYEENEDSSSNNITEYFYKELNRIFGKDNQVPYPVIEIIKNYLNKNNINILADVHYGNCVREILKQIPPTEVDGVIYRPRQFKKYSTNIIKQIYPSYEIPLLHHHEIRRVSYLFNIITNASNELFPSRYKMNYAYTTHRIIDLGLDNNRRIREILKLIYIQKYESYHDKDIKLKQICDYTKCFKHRFTPEDIYTNRNYYIIRKPTRK